MPKQHDGSLVSKENMTPCPQKENRLIMLMGEKLNTLFVYQFATKKEYDEDKGN